MTRPVYFFDTKIGKKIPFVPKDSNSVKIYSCGPTVYNYPHIGNIRSFLFVDTLRKSLKLAGFNLDQTMNITDVDDKIIKESISKDITIHEFTLPWIEVFFKDLETMGIEKIEHYPKATDSIPEMIQILSKLKENGYLYEKDGSCYFSIQKFKDYGKLSKVDFSGMRSGIRYDTDEYDKSDIRDFVLWKNKKEPTEPYWSTEFGEGRPGWHLECSAMIRKIYHGGIDIHTGGIDLVFPHHENEIAQTECAFPDESFVSYWLHCEHLLVDGEKMSKSLGNFYTLRDLLEKGISPLVLRYFFLSAHYRSKLNFSFSKLEECQTALNRIQNCLDRLKLSIPDLEKCKIDFENIPSIPNLDSFLEAFWDDLNTPKAFGILFDACREFNAGFDDSSIESKKIFLDFLSYVDEAFGILDWSLGNPDLDKEWIESKIQERREAKSSRDFGKADLIRIELNGKGISITDLKDGTTVWKKI